MTYNIDTYRYTFHNTQGAKKFSCPQCNKKRYRRYFDNKTQSLLPYEYGICDRIESCKYHNIPSQINPKKPEFISIEKPKQVFIPNEILERTLHGYEVNSFVSGLRNTEFPFDESDISKVIEMYKLGTITKGYMKGAISFPFVDELGRIRAIQVKTFDNQLHTKRTSFIHALKACESASWLEGYNKQTLKVSCLFGAHLLSDYPTAKIGIVESPKTAIIASLYYGFPSESNMIWMSSFNLGGLTFDKLRAVSDREIILFPDTSEGGKVYSNWYSKAEHISYLLDNKILVSNELEKIATDEERVSGYDLADYLLKYDWRLYRK